MEQSFFEAIEILGEGLFGRFQIINMDWNEDRGVIQAYRIYHDAGYCLTIEKLEPEDPKEDIFYLFSSEQFDGYQYCSIQNAVGLIQNEFNSQCHD